MQAFVHSQEALRISGMLFSLSRDASTVEAAQPCSAPTGVTEDTLPSDSPGTVQMDADAISEQDPTSGAAAAQFASTGNSTAASSDGKSGSGVRQRQLSPQLHYPVTVLYLAALYQAGVVYELSGCAEDAVAALKECCRFALPASPSTHALASSLLCRVSRKQGEGYRAALYLEEALSSLHQAGECDWRLSLKISRFTGCVWGNQTY